MTNPSLSIEALIGSYLPPLEREMRAVVQSGDPQHAGLFGMLHYHLGWVDDQFRPCQARAGKRVRPALCLLTCEACGGDWEQALPAAAAVELLHNFTLIHDDIEDRDRKRRGRPTLWALWGEAQAINAGDALFGLSHLALLRLSTRGVPAETVAQAARVFSRTEVTLTCGQFLDIGFEERDAVAVGDYLAMVEGKTAALVACACEFGALVAGACEERRESLRAFGRHLGLAFQVRDDILGVWGDSVATGKPVGADVARRKKSLPILHGLAHSEELRALLARETLSQADVRRAVALLEEVGSREYAERMAGEHHEHALAALGEADLSGPASQSLHDLAQLLLNREH